MEARSLEVVSEEVEAASAAAVLEEEASEAVAPEANSNHNQLLYNDVQQHFWKYLPSHQFGESHGKAIGGVIDGFPAGIAIDMEFIQQELDRRRPGQSAITTARKRPTR